MSDFPASVPAPGLAPDIALTVSGPSWQEQDATLRDLWLKNQSPQVIADALGRSVPAIMTRAARLGLPRRAAPGRKPGVRRQEMGGQGISVGSGERVRPVYQSAPSVAVQTSPRVCLMCLTKFESLGRHNRICSTCKGSSEYESASALPELHVPSS